jgi:outer membrane receptor protein involved in Fe transport
MTKNYYFCQPLFLLLVYTSTLITLPVSAAENELDSLFSLSLEELSNINVTTISRVEEDLDHTAGTVHVITADMIKKRGYRSLKDALQVIPGFTVFHRVLGYVAGVRGLNSNDNEKITLLINGFESNGVNEPEFLNGPINLDNIERVEVIVGPSSLFQQANTLAATVNVITKKTDGVEVVFAHGNDQPYSATLMGGKKWADDRYINATVSYEKKDGFDAWDLTNRVNLAGTTQTGRMIPNVFAIIEGQYENWAGQAFIHEPEWPELGINNTSPLNDGIFKDRMYQLNAEHTYDWSSELTSKSRFGISYKQQDRTHSSESGGSGGEQRISQVDYTAELGFEYSGFKDHFIQSGVQFAFEDNFDSFHSASGKLYGDDTYAVGVYINDTWQYSDKLKLIAGIRADDNTIIDTRIYWGGRFAAIYDVNDKWITKAMVNRAIRMPSPLAALNEKWGLGAPGAPFWADDSPNAEKPEKLTTYELQNIFNLKDTRISTTLYYQQLEDFISWASPHSNTGDYNGYGIELDINHYFTPDLSAWVNASFIDSELTPFSSISDGRTTRINAEGQIIGSTKLTANLGVDYQINKNVNLSSQIRYFTSQASFSRAKNDFETIDNRYYVDAALTYEDFLVEGVDVRLSGQNIFDNTDKLAAQWSNLQYHPRGATYLMTLYMEF